MEEKWDRESNMLTEEEQEEEQSRFFRERMELELVERTLRRQREATNYVEPSAVSAREMAGLLPYQAERLRREAMEPSPFNNETYDLEYYDSHPEEVYSSWWANKLWAICHNCGSVGFKNGRVRKTWKCGGCHSRNVQVVRAADLSRVMREHREVGVHMEDVYNDRQQENRVRRAARSSFRRNRQRTA